MSLRIPFFFLSQLRIPANRNKFKHSGLIEIITALGMAVVPRIHTLILDNSTEIVKNQHGQLTLLST